MLKSIYNYNLMIFFDKLFSSKRTSNDSKSVASIKQEKIEKEIDTTESVKYLVRNSQTWQKDKNKNDFIKRNNS